MIYSHKVDFLHVIHVYHVLALALGVRVTKQPLSEYYKSHSRGKGEEVASHARTLKTSAQVCHVSHGLSFYWPKEVIQPFLTWIRERRQWKFWRVIQATISSHDCPCPGEWVLEWFIPWQIKLGRSKTSYYGGSSSNAESELPQVGIAG